MEIHSEGMVKKLLIFFLLTFNIYGFYAGYIHPPWKHIYSDMAGYVERADNLANGKTLSEYDSFYPAGTTYLYAPFFYFFQYNKALRLLAIFQALLLYLINIIVFFIIWDFYNTERGAWMGSVFSALYFPFLTYGGFYLSEIPFAFFLVLSLYFFCKAFMGLKSKTYKSFIAGIVMGCACIIKGTLYFCLLFFMVIIFLRYGKKLPYLKMILFIAGFFTIMSIQIYHSMKSLGKLTFTSTNGGINVYLGQAHIKKVENIHPSGTYYFYNNNSFYDKTLTEEKTFYFGVWEQEEFYKMVRELWRENTLRQIEISINNGIDLFRIVKHWPARNEEIYGIIDIYFQYLFLTVVYIPSILFLFLFFFAKRETFLINLVILSPVVSVIIMAMMSKGEERYLVPFLYCFIILASTFWKKIMELS